METATTKQPDPDVSRPRGRAAVIFDWDGVIADSVEMFYRAYQQTCEHFGRTLPVACLEEFRAWYKPRWERNYLDMGFFESELPAVLDHARAYVDYGKVRLFPEVVRCLRSLEGEYTLGIASTTDAALIRERLGAEDLLHLFPTVVGGEDGGSDKIARYGEALRSLGAAATESVGVGDTALDVHCARHWGMRTVGVTYGWNAEHLVRAANPDRLVHHPGEVEAAVRALLTC